MTDIDIVTRLRSDEPAEAADLWLLNLEAADEITRLRAELKGAYEQGLLDGREQAVDDYRGAIDSYER